MKIFKQIIIAISIFGFLYPCDCAPLPSPEDAYNMADVVFSGQVTTIVDDWNNLLKEVSFNVYDVWKGAIQDQIIILTGIDDGICGYNFEVNEEYLIYGNYSGDFVWTNICTRTNLLEYASEDFDYLNSLNNTQCDDGYTEYENECYYNDDLNTLTMLIYLNDIEFEVFYDIGITLWENGHINTLILEGLLIHEIPNNIQNLDSLVHLSFSDNQLENIPVELGNLPSLEFLFLSNNQLYELPEQIGNLNNLKFLHLPGNQLTELPASISNLSNLQSLNVDNNLIISMPPNIIYLNSLQYLYIANNEINQLPSDIGSLSELEILSAYTNNISVLPESIGNLFNLYHFDLTNNELIALPETICNIYENLIVFNVGINYICPPYPSCLDVDALGAQDTSSCNEDFECFDFTGLDFGVCAMVLGVGLINDECNFISGCDWTIDGIDYSDLFFDSMDECEEVCDTDYQIDLGDLNDDGSLNILDIILMVGMIMDEEPYDQIADLNQDGSINILDIIALLNLILNPATSCEDIDGNVYETVQIGEQVWMAENLKVTHYNNGDAILTGYSDVEWSWLDSGAYAVYDDNPANVDIYGNLYNWYTVVDERGMCADGWHVPSDTEFMELEMFLGMSESEANSTGSRGTNEGSKLAGRADLWNSGSLEENIEFGTSGFTGFPAGNRDYGNGNYNSMSFFGAFWSSTESNSFTAWNRELEYHSSIVYRFNATKQFGFSIRCIQD